jgi:glycosyltransferase involved in cell wall biosynthesis
VKSLVFWGGGGVAAARSKVRDGATLLLWHEAQAEGLRRAGVAYCSAADLLRVEDADRADAAAIAWTKAVGRQPMLDGKCLRELLVWKGVSLWWFAELYLHHSTSAPHYVRLIETFERLLDLTRPDEVEAAGMDAAEAVLLGRVCTARRTLYHGPVRAAAKGARGAAFSSRWHTLLALGAALKSRLLAAADPAEDARDAVLFLSHAAFWKERTDRDGRRREYEHYFDRLIPEVDATNDLRALVLAVGPTLAHRRRGRLARVRDWFSVPTAGAPYLHVNRFAGMGVFAAVRASARFAREAWRTLRESPAMQAAFSHRGVPFFDLAESALAKTLLLQLPWAVRSYEEIRAGLLALRPEALCLYAESSGWGRAALAAARAAGIPTLAIQHGILYPTYYSYLHEPDEGDCPRPDRTAVFGEAARRFLVEKGGYPPASLAVTGSPKFDELMSAAAGWDRDALRRELGVASGERLILVASRFRGIRRTHQSIGSAFASLLHASAALGAAVLVKPHPAEAPTSYQEVIRATGIAGARVLPASSDLLRLLHACDLLVTVESLSAVEALVLGRPVVILNMPTNLRDMVEAGVAVGVPAGGDPLPALRALLEDPATRARLSEARARYLDDVAKGVDGLATQRIVALLRETIALRDAGAAGPDRAGRRDTF